MMRRALTFVVVFLWSAVALFDPTHAQESVPLRASYQSQFLPEGTEVVVLTREARVQRDGRYQPEFLPLSEFPLRRSLIRARDRLGVDGRTLRTYDRTQDSGLLYFIYALTPDSVFYWSYSAQRDSLKFDVVHAGVMSVAPIESESVREDVYGSIFGRRVKVFMPSEGGDNEGERRRDKKERADEEAGLGARERIAIGKRAG